MRKMLNTLYVKTPEAYLACENENVIVRGENETRFRILFTTWRGLCLSVTAEPVRR